MKVRRKNDHHFDICSGVFFELFRIPSTIVFHFSETATPKRRGRSVHRKTPCSRSVANTSKYEIQSPFFCQTFLSEFFPLFRITLNTIVIFLFARLKKQGPVRSHTLSRRVSDSDEGKAK